MRRSCGVVLPISALPSPYGIGTLGQAAYDFVDFLAEAGQSWWQILPVGPTGYGDSPYQSFSAYAGNPYFVDLDLLCRDGLLDPEDAARVDWGGDAGRVDYGKIYENRFVLLEQAAARGWARDAGKVRAFAEQNAGWLHDYALFMALKRRFGMRAWTEWEDALARRRRPEALERLRPELEEDVRLFTYIQYLFFRQWEALRAYAHSKGVGIIGDLPIYMAMDSADVWADPGSFLLDENHTPIAVAGVPPDCFNAGGQLWGNPLYDWAALAADGFSWWVRRMEGAQRLYDMLRIDHFRGLESYWAVPYGAPTAQNGRWVKGPGMALLRVLSQRFPSLPLIAEDLGYLTPEVRRLLEESGLPGMKVLELAFDSREADSALPHSYPPHCVCYTGTHDNAPLLAWREEAAPEDVVRAVRYLGLNEAEGFHWGMIRGGQSSAAELFLAQMQDYLGLGAEARVNTPGVPKGNWQWRLRPGELTAELAGRMAETARIYGRRERLWQR